MGGEPGGKSAVACSLVEAAEESDHRFKADAADHAEPDGIVVGLALELARVAGLNEDGWEGACGGEESADITEEEADEKEDAHFAKH